MTARLTISAKNTRLGNTDKYTGYITVWSSKDRLYSVSTGINRLTKYDALEDASILKQDMLSTISTIMI